jgi:hypothetical protein
MERSPGTARIVFSNDNVPGVLGHVLSVLAANEVNVVDMMNKSRAELAFNIMDVEALPSDEALRAIQAVEGRDPRAGDLIGRPTDSVGGLTPLVRSSRRQEPARQKRRPGAVRPSHQRPAALH